MTKLKVQINAKAQRFLKFDIDLAFGF